MILAVLQRCAVLTGGRKMRMTYAVQAGGSKPNEDWIGVEADTMLVLDGVTVPPGVETGCVHGTPWYVASLGRAVLRSGHGRPDLDLRFVLAEAIRAVRASHDHTCDVDGHGTPAATVALFRRTEAGCDYLVLSDAFMVAELQDNRMCVVSDRILDSLAVSEREAVYRELIGTPEHTAALLVMVQAQMELRNRRGGYWVAASDPVAAEHALTGHFEPGQVVRAAVMTDGAARLAEPFDLLDWRQMLDVAAASAEAVIARTREVERSDPEGRCWPRYKTSDDAALVYADLRVPARPEDYRWLKSSLSYAP